MSNIKISLFSNIISNKGLIKKLRALGGSWQAIRHGFGTYRYQGQIEDLQFNLDSYAYLSPRWDGDDDTFSIKWHIKCNGENIGYPSNDPISQIKFHLKYNAKIKNLV